MPPRLPPLYTLTTTDADPFAAACRPGREPGMVLWRQRPDRLDCALCLEPDRPLRHTRLVRLVALLAMADALAALAPPKRPVSLRETEVWVDGARVARVHFACETSGEDGVPCWAALGLEVEVWGDPDDPSPGRDPTRSSLRDEGFGEEVDAARVLEGFAYHFLAWLDRWNEGGDAALEHAWRRHRQAQAVP